jgi:hypothetical protein
LAKSLADNDPPQILTLLPAIFTVFSVNRFSGLGEGPS